MGTLALKNRLKRSGQINSTKMIRTRTLVLVLALYLLLALALTYPLVAQFGDHVPGTATWSMDEYGYVWNNWWVKHAIFDLGTSPFQTNLIFYPLGTSLVLYTLTLFHVFLGLPIQFLFGLIPASNGELLFAFVMSGFGAFLLAWYVLRNSGLDIGRSKFDMTLTSIAAFVAGAVFAFASNRFVYASLGHYNVVATEWIPFFVLFLAKTVRELRWSNAFLLGLFAAFAMYVEPTDGVLLLLFSLVYIAFSWHCVANCAAIGRLALAGGFSAVLFSPLLIPTLQEIFNSGYSLPGWGHAEKLLVDLLGFFTPTSLSPFSRNWIQELDQVRQATGRFVDVNTVFVGYVTLALAIAAAIRYRARVRVWVASAIIFAIFSLGPLLHINGQSVFDFDGMQVTVPMPFLLLHYIPLLKENRVPNRFSILIMLSLAVLVAIGVRWVTQKSSVKSEKLALVLAVGFLASILTEHASFPLPLTDARVPDVYSVIARDPGNYAVLTLPLGWRNSFGQQGAEDTRTQFYASAMGKALFSGNVQRNPPYLFDYFDRISLFHSLSQIETYGQVPDDVIARDQADAPGLMAFFNVRYVVMNPSIPGRPPYSDTRGAAEEYVKRVLPLGNKIYDKDGVVAYRINQAPLPSKLQISFGTPAAYIYQAEGWDRDEVILDAPGNWTNQKSARLLLPIKDVADYALTIRALPFAYPQSPPQTMNVSVNGSDLQTFELRAKWDDYALTIPARLLKQGMNDLKLSFGYAVRPRDVFAPSYSIGSTKVTSPVDIVVNSSELGSIKVNGREVSPLGRGYNVAAIDPKNGNVISAKVFRTGDERAQSRMFTDYVAALQAGTIVAVASQENVAGSLGDGTVAALRSLGGRIDIRQSPNTSHVLIGVKGAAPGTALEQAGEERAFIYVGHAADERTLAAAVSTVTVEKK